MIRNHNRFCYHDCIEDTERLMKKEYELYRILHTLDKDDMIRGQVRKKLTVLQRDLFHIRAGHDQV